MAQLIERISINCVQWGQWTRIILLGVWLSRVKRNDSLDELEHADAGGWMLETSYQDVCHLGVHRKRCDLVNGWRKGVIQDLFNRIHGSRSELSDHHFGGVREDKEEIAVEGHSLIRIDVLSR